MEGYERNKPCHCGSGKKYKKCCYSKDEDKHYAQIYKNSFMAAIKMAKDMLKSGKIKKK